MELHDGRRPPKHREPARKIYIMSSIADDHEDFEIVEQTTVGWAKENGWDFSRGEILKQLGGLIRTGLAQAYELSARPPHAIVADYSEENADDLYFYLTSRSSSLYLRVSLVNCPSFDNRQS